MCCCCFFLRFQSSSVNLFRLRMKSKVDKTPSRILIKSFSFNQVADGRIGVLKILGLCSTTSKLNRTLGFFGTTTVRSFLFLRGTLLPLVPDRFIVVVDEAETVVMELSVAPRGIDVGFMMVFQ